MLVRGRRVTSYALVCAIVGVWAVLLVWQHRWGQDIRLHYATLYALERDPLHPGDPMVGGPSAGPYFSPYMLLLAFIAKAGLSATAVFGLAALVNTGLFLWGFRRFVGHISPRPAAASLGLIFTLLLWGWSSYGWSGFLDLRSVSAELPYPAMLGLALMFFVWDALLRYRASADRKALVLLAVLAALLVLIHPFTAVNTAIGATAICLAHPQSWQRRQVIGLVVAGAVVLALVLAWPYSDLTSLFKGSAEFSRIHRPLMRGAASRYSLALIGLPALLLGLRRPLGRELLLLFLGGAGLVAYARYGHSYAYARALPIYGLPLQLALARHLAEPLSRRTSAPAPASAPAEVAFAHASATGSNGPALPEEGPKGPADPPETGRTPRLVYAVATAAVAAVACLGALAGVLPVIPGKTDLGTPQWRIPDGVPDEKWQFLTAHLRQGDVVMTTPTSGGIVNRFGMYSVAPAWPDPFIRDEAARRDAATRFFAPATSPAVRLQIADNYHARCLITTSPFNAQDFPTFHQVASTGHSLLACRS